MSTCAAGFCVGAEDPPARPGQRDADLRALLPENDKGTSQQQQPYPDTVEGELSTRSNAAGATLGTHGARLRLVAFQRRLRKSSEQRLLVLGKCVLLLTPK